MKRVLEYILEYESSNVKIRVLYFLPILIGCGSMMAANSFNYIPIIIIIISVLLRYKNTTKQFLHQNSEKSQQESRWKKIGYENKVYSHAQNLVYTRQNGWLRDSSKRGRNDQVETVLKLSYKHHNTLAVLKHTECVHNLKVTHKGNNEPTEPVTSVSKQTTLLQYTNKVCCIAKTWSRILCLVFITVINLRSWPIN